MQSTTLLGNRRCAPRCARAIARHSQEGLHDVCMYELFATIKIFTSYYKDGHFCPVTLLQNRNLNLNLGIVWPVFSWLDGIFHHCKLGQFL